MGEAYSIMNDEKRARHANWKVKNLKVIENSGILHRKAGGETVLFREEGKPKVDFYPSTGRWRMPGKAKTFRGGARSFINWYNKQNEKD